MADSPLIVILLLLGGGYLASLWAQDYRAGRAGRPNPRALPGATPAPARALVIGAAGGLLLLAIQVAGESRLGLTAEQSQITVLFGVYTLMAAFLEEVVFRGYLVITQRGPGVRIAAMVGASLLFALVHPFLWSTEEGFHWTLDRSGWFYTASIFANSLWFYLLRFAAFNPQQSLLPSIAAHAAFNLGVFGVKAAQGFVSGPW